MQKNRYPALLAIARHGESLRNYLYDLYGGDHIFMPEEAATELRRYGNHDIPLTEKGRVQALELGRRLKSLGPFDAIYHSGYLRAHDTAYLITQALDIRSDILQCDVRFRERDAGYAFHMTKREVLQHFPWLLEYWEREGWFLARPPGGESLADLHEGRIDHALGDILEGHRNQRVLVVCHGRAQQVARLILDRVRIEYPQRPFGTLPNCGTIFWDYAKDDPETTGVILT